MGSLLLLYNRFSNRLLLYHFRFFNLNFFLLHLLFHRAHGSSLRLGRFLRSCHHRGGTLVQAVQVNLTKWLELLVHLYLRSFFLLFLLLLLFLREDHLGLFLDILVALKLLDQRLILCVADLGIWSDVVLYLAETLLIL